MRLGRGKRNMTGKALPPKWSRASFKERVLMLHPDATVARVAPKFYKCTVPMPDDPFNPLASITLAYAKSPSRVWKDAYLSIYGEAKDT